MNANYSNKQNNDAKIEQALKEQLTRQFTRGLSQGSKAMCGVILEKVNKYNDSNADAVYQDIKSFCEKSLGLPEVK